MTVPGFLEIFWQTWVSGYVFTRGFWTTTSRLGEMFEPSQPKVAGGYDLSPFFLPLSLPSPWIILYVFDAQFTFHPPKSFALFCLSDQTVFFLSVWTPFAIIYAICVLYIMYIHMYITKQRRDVYVCRGINSFARCFIFKRHRSLHFYDFKVKSWMIVSYHYCDVLYTKIFCRYGNTFLKLSLKCTYMSSTEKSIFFVFCRIEN